MTGLLVLAVLLLSGVPAYTHNDDHHAGPAQVMSLAATTQIAASGGAAPCADHRHDHGLICCIGARCGMGVGWLSATGALEPPLLPAAQDYPDRVMPSAIGLATAPALHPPERIA